MDNSSKYDIPWELISESLTGSLSSEEEIQLQQWLSSSPEHKEKYSQILELWKNGMDDYGFYKIANENEAWKSFQSKLDRDAPDDSDLNESKVIQGQFITRRKLFRNLMAAAAVFVAVLGIGIWFLLSKSNPVVYETAANEQRKVILKDGSTITLYPLTKIEVSPGYNKTTRTLLMPSGTVDFDVKHRPDLPFIVELGSTQIRDIGTSFTIQKGEKKINVMVTTGKVVFSNLTNKENRELPAGTGVSFDVQNESFGDIESSNSLLNNKKLLNFKDTPLEEVLVAIQNVYGKKVVVTDSNINHKKITATLEGMPYQTALKVICKSLGLDCIVNDSIYILKEKK
jgi:transmembrane sensor